MGPIHVLAEIARSDPVAKPAQTCYIAKQVHAGGQSQVLNLGVGRRGNGDSSPFGSPVYDSNVGLLTCKGGRPTTRRTGAQRADHRAASFACQGWGKRPFCILAPDAGRHSRREIDHL